MPNGFYRIEHPHDGFSYMQREGVSNLLVAADCLSEVKNHREISKITDRLLEKLKQEVAQNSSDAAFLGNTASYALTEAIAVNWKNHPEVLHFLKKMVTQGVQYDEASDTVPSSSLKSIAWHWAEESSTFSFIKSQLLREDENAHLVSAAALSIIILDWRGNPETLSLLKKTAESGRMEMNISKRAMNAIVSYWKSDSETLSWLKKIAQTNLLFLNVGAVRAIASNWKDLPDTLPWLKELAESKQFSASPIAGGAIPEIVNCWKDDPEILPWLMQLAKQSKIANVRGDAFRALAKHWTKNASVVGLLRECAQNDDDEKLRTWAQEQIARLELNP
jgi:hypothetical protein